MRKFPKLKLLLTVFGIFLWFLTFSAGVLLDSAKYRKALGFNIDSEKISESLELLGRTAAADTEAAAGGEAKLEAIKDLYRQFPLKDSDPNREKKEEQPSKAWSFLCASILFMPLNVLLLTLLAAFIGGCASNEADIQLHQKQSEEFLKAGDLEGWAKEERHINYMKEDPVHSMVRGLIVYLVVISGLYIAVADPFTADGQSGQLAQYVRLAGLLSVLGFVVGYDPSLFPVWIAMIPTPSPRRSSGTSDNPSEDQENSDLESTVQVTQTNTKTVAITESEHPSKKNSG